MHTEKNTRIPIARCPSCRHSLLYARDPRKKKDITVRIAEPDFDGKTMLCSKCKTMLAVIETIENARKAAGIHFPDDLT